MTEGGVREDRKGEREAMIQNKRLSDRQTHSESNN